MENNKPFNIFDMAQKQFDRSADLMNLDRATRQILRIPMREYQFSLPIALDSGETQVLQAFTVQFNDARGPTKGGVRFHPSETVDTIRALAMWMTWKCAVMNLPLGGSSSGVVCDPHSLSSKEMERICRGFVRRIAHFTGPERDVLGPDIMTGPQEMLWMLDEFETIHNRKSPGFITGKPVTHAGSKGRKEACGYGAMVAAREAMKDLGVKIENTTASIQGFGSTGQHAAKLYSQMGGKIICVSCWDQKERSPLAYRKPEGIQYGELVSITNSFGEIDRARAEALGCDVIPGDEWIQQNVDILVPAAVEYQIRPDNIQQINDQVKLIVEAANGPTDPDVDQILRQRDILVIPDILANAGGVVVSYFEQVQSNMNYFWGRDEVLAKLDAHMTSAYIDVSNFSAQNEVLMRDSAYMLALDRVARASLERGWI